jgi:hypothetical protein
MLKQQIEKTKDNIARFMATESLPYPYTAGNRSAEHYAAWRVGEGRLEAWFDCENELNLTLRLASHRVHFRQRNTSCTRTVRRESDGTLLYIDEEECTPASAWLMVNGFLCLVKADRATVARPMGKLVNLCERRPKTRDASPVRKVKFAL